MSTSQQIHPMTSIKPIDNTFIKGIVWAVNLGGPSYKASNGIHFEQDQLNNKLRRGSIDTILGSQDPTLYQSFLAGHFQLNIPLDNGVYDITFLFAEPNDIAVGERVFNVVVNNKIELPAIDDAPYNFD